MVRISLWVLLLMGVVWAQSISRQPSRSTGGSNIDPCGTDEKCQTATTLVAREFGPTFKLNAAIPMLTADLDGDGNEDAVLVATAKDVLVGQLEFHYKVIDPYNSYFGFGDPKITARFMAQESSSPMLLIVHNWRAAAPRAKFVVINLPFRTVSITRQLIKKKVLTVIRAEEVMGLSSFLYWTGKQYKWEESKLE